MKHLVFVCRYAEPFRTYAFPIDGGSADITSYNSVLLLGLEFYVSLLIKVVVFQLVLSTPYVQILLP